MIRRYQILLPARVAMLIKVLVMLEGTSRLACPKFCLMEVMGPHQRKMAWRQMSPAYRLRKWRRTAGEALRLAEWLPRGLGDILLQVQSGKFDIHLDHRGLEPSVNRLVLGLLASALFVGSSLLLSRNVRPVVPWPAWVADAQISLLGAFGAILSFFLGFLLLRAINKSGHLDRH
jgi:ubiquinone biosynthesis protein